jgi:hypothetical protein
MLALLLFYQGGSALLFQYFINRSDAVIEDHIIKNMYKPSELVEIKIPVKMQAITNWEDYEPISGQVQLSGNCYNYVMLKVTRDTMFLKVIPNHEKTRLINANIIYAKQVSDAPVSKKSTIPPTKRSITDNEYNFTFTSYQTKVPVTIIKATGDFSCLNIIDPSLDVPGQPPEVVNTLS